MEQIASTITPSIPLDDDALVTAPEARSRWFGGISEATEWRWSKQLEGFPKPVRIHRRKYYRVGDLREFYRTLAVA
jgi:hypothetical protein